VTFLIDGDLVGEKAMVMYLSVYAMHNSVPDQLIVVVLEWIA